MTCLFSPQVVNLITLPVLYFTFKEPQPQESKPPAGTSSSNASHTTRDIYILYISFLGINFFVRAVLGTVETLGPYYNTKIQSTRAKPKFISSLLCVGAPVVDGWLATLPEASKKISSGYFFSVFGIVGIMILLVLMFLAANIKDYPTLLVGLGTQTTFQQKKQNKKESNVNSALCN